MTRRAWLVASASGTLSTALPWPLAMAQTPPLPRHIGVLSVSSEAAFASSLQGLRDGLRAHGHVEGRDIVIDVRHADGRAQELPRLASELAARQPALIVATGAAATAAVLAASAEVPVVALGDLVAAGHAAQLNRPGGRVTGVSFLPAPLNAKRLELLAAVVPKGSAILNLRDPNSVVGTELVEAAGRALGLTLHAAFATTPAQIEEAFVSARRLRVAGVNVLNSPFLSFQHARIIALAAQARLPAIYQWPESARAGGLMAYGPSLTGMFRQLAGFASRLLAGARAADLPVEQPTRIELSINRKTARALGLTLPESLLLRADEVFE